MDQIVEWLKEYDYIMFLVGALLFVWLYWLPRIVAPVLMPRYNKFPPKLKAVVNLLLPTIESALRNGWDYFYTEVVKEIVEETETDLDDKVWGEADKLVHKALRKDVGYYPKEEQEHPHG